MDNTVYYSESSNYDVSLWSLLHEVGHAVRHHKSYEADFTLLRLEVEAWEEARIIAKSLDIEISESHIQDCLDTYRDWLYRRSVCPSCSAKCFQQDDFKHYQCFNCHSQWRVSPSRFCRSYRAKEKESKVYVFA